MLNPKKITDCLSKSIKKRLFIECVDCVESTNDLALRYSPDTVIVADEQTKGRGREGRTFYSGRGGIYMSVALAGEDVDRLTVRAASAVCGAIEEVVGIPAAIKWVNDVICRGKKACGILCESRVMGDEIKAVVGIGINYSGEIPPHLKDIAGTLDGKKGEEERLVAEILNRFYLDRNFLDFYRSKSLVVGKEVEVDGRLYLATGIDDRGGLILEGNGERIVKSTGEIRIPLSRLV